MKRGFSLVELSIVLVILGLLVGGILAGQSLIRAAELRAVTTEYGRWVTASQSFRDKYFSLPGDMRNATSFWGDDNTNCPDAAITNGTPGTCNGDGNGRVLGGIGGNATSESLQYWKHLALAGLIEGSYTGIAGANGMYHCIIGTGCPRSKLNNAGWGIHSLGTYGGDVGFYAANYGNMITFGGQSGEYPYAPVLKPEEAWNIDTKLDDGRPGLGSVMAIQYLACTTSATATATTGVYRLDSNSLACALSFNQAF